MASKTALRRQRTALRRIKADARKDGVDPADHKAFHAWRMQRLDALRVRVLAHAKQ